MKFKCVYIKFRFNKCSFFVDSYLFIIASEWLYDGWLAGLNRLGILIYLEWLDRPRRSSCPLLFLFSLPLSPSLSLSFESIMFTLSLSIFRSLSVKIRRNLMNFNYNLLFLLSIVSAFKCFFFVLFIYLFIYTFWTKKIKNIKTL